MDEKFDAVIDITFKGPRNIATRVFYGDKNLPLIRTEAREKPTITNRIKISVENRCHQRAFAKFVYQGNMEISDRDEPGHYIHVSLEDPDQDFITRIIMPVLHDFKVGAHPSRYSVTGIIHDDKPTSAKAKEILDSMTKSIIQKIKESDMASWNLRKQRRKTRPITKENSMHYRPPVMHSITEEDVNLVAQQASVDKEKARRALIEANGDLARAILHLTTD